MARKRPEPSDEPEDDRPWTEERWEAFMKEGDLRAARFGELLETLHDDPDHEVKIAREMGWDDFADALEADSEAEADDQSWREGAGDSVGEYADDDDDDDEPDAAPPPPRRRHRFSSPQDPAESGSSTADTGDAGSDQDDPFPDDDDDDRVDVKTIPAFQVADRIGMKLHHALQPIAQKYVPPDDQEDFDNADDEDIARLIGQARIGCHIAAAKISGGNAMGYDDEVLCGNIVNCRRGLQGVDDAIAALQELKERKIVPAELADELTRDAAEVKKAVEERIAELRKRVWWS